MTIGFVLGLIDPGSQFRMGTEGRGGGGGGESGEDGLG
jgi:hypothetical protein